MSSPRILRSPSFRLFCGAICIAFAPIFVRLTSIGPTASGFYRTFFAFLMLFLWMIVRDGTGWRQFREILSQKVSLLCVLLPSILFSLDLYFWHKSVIYAGAGVATLLANTQVFYLALFGSLFLGERPTLKYFLCVVVGFVGIGILVYFQPVQSEWPDYRLGVMLGLLTGLVYASYILSMRHLEKRIGQVRLYVKIAAVSLMTSFFLSIFLIAEGGSFLITGIDIVWMALLAFIPQVLGWYLITQNLPLIEVSLAGLLLLLQPVMSIALGILLLSEPLTLSRVAGVGLTLFAIFLGERIRRRMSS